MMIMIDNIEDYNYIIKHYKYKWYPRYFENTIINFIIEDNQVITHKFCIHTCKECIKCNLFKEHKRFTLKQFLREEKLKNILDENH